MVIGNRQWSPLENEGGRMVWKGTGELPGLWKSSIPRSVWWLYVYMYATKNPLICALKSQQLVNFVVVQSLCVLCFIAQSCPTLSTPWTAALQAPLPLGILQARTLEWVAVPVSRGSSQPRDRTKVSRIAGRFFTTWAPKEALLSHVSYCIYIIPQ